MDGVREATDEILMIVGDSDNLRLFSEDFPLIDSSETISASDQTLKEVKPDQTPPSQK